MDEIKRGPGRPPKLTPEMDVIQFNGGGRKLRFVQIHDSMSPLQMAPMMSLATIGDKKCEFLEHHPGDQGVYATIKGREFFIPHANISFMEFDNA